MNNEFTSSKSQTDWQRLDAMTDEDIDFSDCPEITPEMFAKAVVQRGLPNPKTKAQVLYALTVMFWSGLNLKVVVIKPRSTPYCENT